VTENIDIEKDLDNQKDSKKDKSKIDNEW
jgi:hypothetical protein